MSKRNSRLTALETAQPPIWTPPYIVVTDKPTKPHQVATVAEIGERWPGQTFKVYEGVSPDDWD